MEDEGKAVVRRLTTGAPGLDEILGGGFPDRSLNIIAGGPGTGKSVLALQMLFHNVQLGGKAIYFTTLAEPALKFHRYMQQFSFFDPTLMPEHLSFFDLSAPILSRNPQAVLDAVHRQVEEVEPVAIAIDSFKVLRDQFQDPLAVRGLTYELAVDLTVAGVTTFLVGEYDLHDIAHLPEFFVTDGIVVLRAEPEGLREVRTLQVVKLRGSGFLGGAHFVDISSAGITVYPRITVPAERRVEPPSGPIGPQRLPIGIPGLDRMLGGGIPARSATLVEGGTGTGKTLLALSFLIAGTRRGEPGLLFTMEETREQLVDMARDRGWDLEMLEEQGLLRVIYTAPVELAADALLQTVRAAIRESGAKYAVIDSLTSLGMSVGAEGRFRDLVYTLTKTFRSQGVTTFFTAEIPEVVGSATLSGRGISSIVDNIILMRYVEIGSALRRAIAVLKMRGSEHEHVLKELLITRASIDVGEPFTQYRGVLTGVPTPAPEESGRRPSGRGGGSR